MPLSRHNHTEEPSDADNDNRLARKSDRADCSLCATLLQQAFLQVDSKPAHLFRSMLIGATPEPATTTSTTTNNGSVAPPPPAVTWEPTADGVRVKIPVDASSTTHHTTTSTEGRDVSDRLRRRFTSRPPTNAATTSFATAVQRHASRRMLLSTSAAAATTTTTATTKTIPTEWLHITCRRCDDVGPEGNARAFVLGPTPLSIVVCHNRLPTTSSSLWCSDSTTAASAAVAEMLLHESIHVYDARHLQRNLLDCRQLAHSEVRAAREAECQSHEHPPHQQHRPSSSYAGRQFWAERCVRTAAVTAVRNLFPDDEARTCVEDVFAQAYADRRPFDTHHHDSHSPTDRGADVDKHCPERTTTHRTNPSDTTYFSDR